MTLQPKHVILTALLLTGLLMSVLTASFSYYTNGGFGFPLDDPWIHLQFAKNLHDYGSFSYYKNEMITSGSTSPLYTLLLAAGFFATGNEMILSYVLGVAFLLVGGFFFFRLSERFFTDSMWAAAAATLLFLLEPRLQWIALSGMETTMFIALVLAAVYYYSAQRPIALGVAGGLLLWARPEAVILFGAIAANEFYNGFAVRGNKEKNSENRIASWRWVAGIMLLFSTFYVGFNFLLSGTILPNTYAAKIKYYSAGNEGFPQQVFAFLSGDLQAVLAVFVGIGILSVVTNVFRRRTSVFLVPLLFSAGLFGAYWMKLPYLYQNGRYLMPLLPFVILLGVHGVAVLKEFLGPRVSFLAKQASQVYVVRLILALLVLLNAYGSWKSRELYQDYCRYITDRQVRTALWMRDRLPESAVIATHDVGAIAFYSGKRIVDMVGLISPEMIQNIGNLDKLRESLVQQKVTHLAVLRNWFEVVNVNALFQTDEQKPEIMEVFPYDPGRVHITSQRVNWLTDIGWRYLAQGNVQQGGPYVENAVQADSNSSRAHHHFGWALMMVNQYDRSEEELRKALQLNPEYWSAYFALAQVPLRRGNVKEGIARLESLVKMNPNMFAALQQLAQIWEQQGDTARARMYYDRFNKGMESVQR